MNTSPILPLTQRLEFLEAWLSDHADTAGLAELGGAEELERLFSLELRMLLRRGPGPGPTPKVLLSGAAEAAANGFLALAAVGRLRHFLDRQEALLKEAEAWTGEPWWAPLPPPSPLEVLAEKLPEAFQWPAGEEISNAFAADGPLWWLADPLLDPFYLDPLTEELEAAFGEGPLVLEQGAVGAAGQTSTVRSDEVIYLDGLEPELLAVAPHAAALIQTALGQLAETLGQATGEQVVLAPERAMLARYPAPSAGYQPHLDNPGGEQDNGRARTLVLYLNPAEAMCAGGELALWSADSSTADEPAAIVSPRPGRAALFDSRRIPHQVQALRPGPPRWALTVWLNDRRPPRLPASQLPELDLTDLLLPISSPPLPADRVLFHRLDGRDPRGELRVVQAPTKASRFGIVSTVYRCGPALVDWCEHHLALGVTHLLLIFDHLEQPAEKALAAELRRRWPSEVLQIWSGAELHSAGWPTLEHSPEVAKLRQLADGGGSSYAVAARQALNASMALEAARGDQLGGEPLDWLLHIDGDELFHLEGDGRGGGDLDRHLAAAEQAGWNLLRYLNHELLPWGPIGAPQFKLHPLVAAARLGSVGWGQLEDYLRMAPADARPYFTSYRNGKAAVRVEAARAAAGVHSWALRQPAADTEHWLAGPSVLHGYCPTAAEFATKYRSKAAAPAVAERPFEPSPAEIAALAAISRLEATATDEPEIAAELGRLHRKLAGFEPAELDLLAEAGLLLTVASSTAERFVRRLLAG